MDVCGAVEMASLPWSLMKFSGSDNTNTSFAKQVDEFLNARLKHMEDVLAKRKWLAGTFP